MVSLSSFGVVVLETKIRVLVLHDLYAIDFNRSSRSYNTAFCELDTDGLSIRTVLSIPSSWWVGRFASDRALRRTGLKHPV